MLSITNINVVYWIAHGHYWKILQNTSNTYAITLSSLLMRPDRAPITSWEAIGNPRELRALTARWIWLMVESSLTAARRMSRVSLDTGIYASIKRKHNLNALTMLQLCEIFIFRKNTLNLCCCTWWWLWQTKAQIRTFPYLASWNCLTGFSSKEERVNTCWVKLGF